MTTLARRLIGRLISPRDTFSGVYERLSDVPGGDAVFGRWLIDEMAATTRAAMAQAAAGVKPYLWHEALALLSGTVASRTGHVRIVDFGGGVGSGFVQVTTALPPATVIDYAVVDAPTMCHAGQSLFANDPRIKFVTAMASIRGAVDIVYANSVLQYVDGYAAALKELASLNAPHVLLARLAAGSGPTFATRQVNVPQQILPYWFLNFDEVVAIMASAGYALTCDTLLERAYDQRDLPETHRIERFRNALFTRGA